MSGSETTPTPSLWRRLYTGWLEIAARFGEVQTLILLTLIYAFVIGPMAIGAALARQDLLHKRSLWLKQSAWSESDSVSAPDLERAKRLF